MLTLQGGISPKREFNNELLRSIIREGQGKLGEDLQAAHREKVGKSHQRAGYSLRNEAGGFRGNKSVNKTEA